MVDKRHYETVDDYMNDQPQKTRAALVALRECILEAAPDAAQLINYDIPAFALIKGGKREAQVMIAGFAQLVGLYPHPLDDRAV